MVDKDHVVNSKNDNEIGLICEIKTSVNFILHLGTAIKSHHELTYNNIYTGEPR